MPAFAGAEEAIGHQGPAGKIPAGGGGESGRDGAYGLRSGCLRGSAASAPRAFRDSRFHTSDTMTNRMPSRRADARRRGRRHARFREE